MAICITRHRAITAMNVSRHGSLPSHSSRSINTEAHVLPPRRREASESERLFDVTDSDSSIEIIEGNMFTEKGTGDKAKKSKPYAPMTSFRSLSWCEISHA